MIDRYTKGVLTLIALALLYLCAVLTPLPAAQAQVPQGTQRPGEYAGPLQVSVVGWKAQETVRVFAPQALPVDVSNSSLRVSTERSTGQADRVVIVGYENQGSRERQGTMRPLNDAPLNANGLPVEVHQK